MTAGGVSLASPAARISGREKAAIIVRLLLSEGASLPLDSLPERLQTALTTQMAEMPSIDRTIVRAVVEEFCARLDAIGLSFPGGIDGALSLLDGHISPSAAQKLRKLAGLARRGDPWERIAGADPERLVAILGAESVEVGAVILSKLSVPRAAELLGRLPGDRARRIAFAISQTGNVDPDTVLRVGQSVAAEIDNVPPRAFETGPVERVGAILNHAAAMTRDDVLIGLDDADKGFADAVRKAIFTFANIPARINPRDVPKIVRAVDQPILLMALAFSAATGGAETVEFILGNMSQRLASGIRDEIEGLGPVKEKDGEAAKGMIVAAIRDLESSGEIFLVVEDEE
jgi:flagellar motor switch protein FliG